MAEDDELFSNPGDAAANVCNALENVDSRTLIGESCGTALIDQCSYVAGGLTGSCRLCAAAYVKQVTDHEETWAGHCDAYGVMGADRMPAVCRSCACCSCTLARAVLL